MLPVVMKFGVIKSKLYLVGGTAVSLLGFIILNKHFNFSVQHILSISDYGLILAISILSLISILTSYLIKKYRKRLINDL